MTDIIDIVREAVERTACAVTIHQSDGHGNMLERKHPEINYIFGNDQYIKDMLDQSSRTFPAASKGACVGEGVRAKKFPLVALFTPITEERGLDDVDCRAKVSLLIACSSRKEWSNEQRKMTSFELILHPIYEELMKQLGRHSSVRVPYSGHFRHDKTDNYSYGRYGAYTQSGESVSEPIDAVVIQNLRLELIEQTCKR